MDKSNRCQHTHIHALVHLKALVCSQCGQQWEHNRTAYGTVWTKTGIKPQPCPCCGKKVGKKCAA